MTTNEKRLRVAAHLSSGRMTPKQARLAMQATGMSDAQWVEFVRSNPRQPSPPTTAKQSEPKALTGAQLLAVIDTYKKLDKPGDHTGNTRRRNARNAARLAVKIACPKRNMTPAERRQARQAAQPPAYWVAPDLTAPMQSRDVARVLYNLCNRLQ